MLCYLFMITIRRSGLTITQYEYRRHHGYYRCISLSKVVGKLRCRRSNHRRRNGTDEGKRGHDEAGSPFLSVGPAEKLDIRAILQKKNICAHFFGLAGSLGPSHPTMRMSESSESCGWAPCTSVVAVEGRLSSPWFCDGSWDIKMKWDGSTRC